MKIREKHEVIVGLEELLLDSALRLKEAVKEEKDYLKQQGSVNEIKLFIFQTIP